MRLQEFVYGNGKEIFWGGGQFIRTGEENGVTQYDIFR